MLSGLTAIISILGVSWLGSSFFEGNRTYIVNEISGLVQLYPLTFAVGMFLLSTLLFSQAATVSLFMPVGLALGVPVPLLIDSIRLRMDSSFCQPTGPSSPPSHSIKLGPRGSASIY